MEQRLRDYAGRRRRALGPRLDMPAPLRHRLHLEVGRGTQPSRRASPAGWRLAFIRLRQPWALGTLAVLLFAGVFGWTRLKDDRTEVASGKASETMPLEPAPVAAPPAPALGQIQPRLAASHDPTALTPALSRPTGEGAPATAGAGERVRRFMAGEQVPSTSPGGRPVARGAPALSEAAPSVQMRYAQRTPVSRLPALNSFRFEQVGEGFRIVDEDGSVYRAEVQVAPGVGRSSPAPLAVQPAAQSAMSAAPRPGSQVLRVSALGTNHSLQQRVSLAGNLVMTNVAGAPQLENTAAILTNQAAFRLLLSNSRLEGRAVVGVSNQVTILAVPWER
jgi:hypothetical protein